MFKTSFNPSIQMLPYPINTCIDDVEDDDNAFPLYNVIVSQGNLKLMLLVVHRPPGPGEREYEVVRGNTLVITGIKKRDRIMEDQKAIIHEGVSNDVTITNKVFAYTLAPFGIKLLKVNVHTHEFIEADHEGRGFVFEDPVKHEELKDRVNKVCQRMMAIPEVNQF